MDKRILLFIASYLFAVVTLAAPSAQINNTTPTSWAKEHHFQLSRTMDGERVYCKVHEGIGCSPRRRRRSSVIVLCNQQFG